MPKDRMLSESAPEPEPPTPSGDSSVRGSRPVSGFESSTIAIALERSGLLDREGLVAAVENARNSGQSLLEFVLTSEKVSEQLLVEALAKDLRLMSVKLATLPPDPEVVRLIPEDMARKYLCLPLEKDAGDGSLPGRNRRRPVLTLAMADPTDLGAIQDIEFRTGCSVKPVVAARSDVLDAIEHSYEADKTLAAFLANVGASEGLTVSRLDASEADESDSESAPAEGPAVKIVNIILQQAIREGASDIHVEPTEHDVLVRTRVQGMLREYMKLPRWLQNSLTSRLKILAKLDIAERRRPQDGRIRVHFGGGAADLRVSTLPTHYGEKVVLRILGAGQEMASIERLGLSPEQSDLLRKASKQPQGIILVTGPTGSGKTTTLYALINDRKRPEINIVTVEDPVEYELAGINQVQVNTKAGLSFASSLRSILRQDPDVILIGEIRDLETAEIAFQAAMTGHLVLSTLHTNSTVATITRLLDLGVDPVLVSSSLNLVLAQRLVRKLCPECREPAPPDPKLLARLQLPAQGFNGFHSRGCSACDSTGYSGRRPVFEFLRMTPQVKELVRRRASEVELRKAAVASGTIFLLQDALEKVRQGVTSLEEVVRVVQLEEDVRPCCPQCGSPIDAFFTSCPYCLAPLKRTCATCQQELKPGWLICPYCGAAASKTAAPPAAERPEPAPAAVPEPALGSAAPPAPLPAPPARRPSILVADDDSTARALIVRALGRLASNPEVVEASNGIEALNLAETVKPDLVILDVSMPGLSGYEVCQKLRSNLPTTFIPILMVTANTDEESRTRGFLVGTDDYMGKPLSVPELDARVARLLRRTYGL